MKNKTILLSITITLIFWTSIVCIAQDSVKGSFFDPDLFSDLHYRCVGPTRGGRSTTVTGVPSEPGTFYFGAVGGGVWKSTDYGQSWKNISDGFFETASIGAIRVADSDPNIIYVGTGSDGIRSNVITGRGVYKSVDAGKTWQFIGLRQTGQIGAVEIHPGNPDIVFVAAIGQAFGPNPERGVFRTMDGGQSWKRVLFVSDSTGAVDLDFSPDNPDEIYASMWRAERKPWTIISGGIEGGIYKSEDGGDNWKKLGGGLPTGIIGKSDLAVSRDNPDRLYVLFEAPVPKGGLYRSEDRGKTFELISTKYELLDRPFYYCNIDADPNDADVVYANVQRYFKSTDGGETWERRSSPHGDNHDQWINPNDSDLFIQSNDGGVNVTRDGGKTWSTQRNQPTAELYQVNVDDQTPYWIYAGQQDNSTIMVPSFPPYSHAGGPIGFWRSIGGCETGPAVPKPGNHNIVYANCKGRFGRYNKLTGQEKQYYVGASNMYGHNPRDLKYRFQRVSPIHVSPHNPDVVYHASQFVHRTTDEGVTWETISPDLTAFTPETQVISGSPITRDITGEEFYSTIYALQESPLEKGLIWVGANDGPIHITKDGGKTWDNVTPKDLPPGGRVQTVEPSPHNPAKAYVALYRYLLGDWQPYIYRTNDYGKSWTRLTTGTNGIPADSPTRVIREDPDREGLLYAGTEFGLYISFDDGLSWQSFQLDMPVTPVTDIKVYRKDLVLSTMGRSFWILDNLTPLHQLAEEITKEQITLFNPKDAIRFRYFSWRRGPSVPEYPTVGAAIDYYLAEELTEAVTLEIMDSHDNVIRTFSSEKPEKDKALPKLSDPSPTQKIGRNRLSKEKGFHRFVWDLRHPGAWSEGQNRGGRGGRGGPMVIPGIYKARLSTGNWTKTVNINVSADPRVLEDGLTPENFKSQVSLALKTRDLMSRANLAAAHIKKINKDGSHTAKLTELEKKLITAEGRYPQPMLQNQIGYLYSMLDRADQIPGRDAVERYEELSVQLNNLIKKLKKLID